MAMAMMWLMLASLLAVGIVSPAWRELPMAALAVSSGLLMLVDQTSEMPLSARVTLWFLVSAVYTAWQWRARIRLVEPLER